MREVREVLREERRRKLQRHEGDRFGCAPQDAALQSTLGRHSSRVLRVTSLGCCGYSSDVSAGISAGDASSNRCPRSHSDLGTIASNCILPIMCFIMRISKKRRLRQGQLRVRLRSKRLM